MATVDTWKSGLIIYPSGLTAGQIPELIQMARDEELHRADSDSLEVWAPIHAWRALGQLRAEAAIVPLLRLLERIDEEDDDWVVEELPVVFGMIGPTADLGPSRLSGQ